MRATYLRVEKNEMTRKVAIDLAFLAKHGKIRFPKYLFEDGLYLPFVKNPKENNNLEQYFLTKDKIEKEDQDFYYFNFPFKPEQYQEFAI